jgi:hypothetical protein
MICVGNVTRKRASQYNMNPRWRKAEFCGDDGDWGDEESEAVIVCGRCALLSFLSKAARRDLASTIEVQ